MCVLAAALLLLQGCLVPQSVEPITTRPHTVPRVDMTSLPNFMLQPVIPLDPQGPADQSPPCHCQLEVGLLAIIADDPTVDVDVRVFVDYDVNLPRPQGPVTTVHLRGGFDTSVTTRPLQLPPFDSSLLGGNGVHVVELVIGEAAGFAPETVFPPQRAMLPSFESSTFKFVVQVLHDPARQSCGDSPPPPSPAQMKICP
jgi:hypothetical protein